MSERYPGGLITKTPVTPSGPYETSTASGIWTLEEQAYWRKLNQWPIAGSPVPDPQFNYVTMLLHGDGTNGAQNNTFLDSSTNNFTITRNGNTTQGSFSPYGSNWSFFNPDATGGISVPTSTGLDLGTGDFTIEAWVNTSKLPTTNAFQTSAGGYQNIFGTGPDNSVTGTSMYIGVTNLKFEISTDGGGPIDVAHNMVAGVWYHIAVSRSGNTFRAFINGALVQTGTSSASANNGYGWGIMRSERIGGSAFNGAWWFGYVSNFRVVKGTAVYTSAFTPSTAPLTAISGTSLLTCQSNRFIDTSSTAATVTVAGSTSVQRFNPFGTATAYSTSVIGGSAYFDGTGDSLVTPTTSTLNIRTGAFQIDFWMYSLAVPAQFVGPFGTNNAGGNGGIFFAYRSGNLDFVNNFDTAGVISAPYPKINEWHHIALVRNSSNVRSYYIDGVRVGTLSNSVDFDQTEITIGNTSWYGYLSNFRYIVGSNIADPNSSTITVPTAPTTAVSGTQLLTNFTNGAIFDNAMMNDLETVGNAQISTSVKKYGTGSLAFDGTEDYLSTLGNPLFAFGTGDFTIECWLNITTFNGGVVVDFRPTTTNGNYPLIYLNSSTLEFYASGATQIASGTLTTGTWFHFALSRSGSSMKMFINGTQAGSTYTASVNYSVGTLLGIGTSTYVLGSSILNGYIDEFRITKGYARYTANFTPPTAAFPNIGPT